MKGSLLPVGLAAVLLAGSAGGAQADEGTTGRGSIPELPHADSSVALAPVDPAVAAAVSGESLLAARPRGSMRALSVPGYLVWDAYADALGDTAKTPELTAAAMAVPINDPTTAFDETSLLVFAATVSPVTDAKDWAYVALDVNGDLTDDFLIESPDVLMVQNEVYSTAIYRFDGVSWVSTGQAAAWSFYSDGYAAGLDWRALGRTSARFAFGLTDLNRVNYDWAPNDYTGGLITLPPADWDGDGVIDAQDACPAVAGPASSGGCPPPPPPPDTDRDGVIDANDTCPSIVGVAAYAGCPPPPSAAVTVKAKSGRSKLYVDVNPNESSGFWTFQVQRRQPDGSWTPMKTYKTKGSKETRTINLRKGTYRVEVHPKYGHLGAISGEVTLKR